MTINKEVLSALIGLMGAINNHGKTETTDEVIRRALLGEADDNAVSEIHSEKNKISPDCATCKTPCGNTSDYPMEAYDEWPDEIRRLKEQIMDEILRVVENTNIGYSLPDVVLKGIAYIGYDLGTESYLRLLEELKHQ